VDVVNEQCALTEVYDMMYKGVGNAYWVSEKSVFEFERHRALSMDGMRCNKKSSGCITVDVPSTSREERNSYGSANLCQWI